MLGSPTGWEAIFLDFLKRSAFVDNLEHDKLGVWGLIRCSGQTLRTEYIPKPEVFLRNSRFWDKNSNF